MEVKKVDYEITWGNDEDVPEPTPGQRHPEMELPLQEVWRQPDSEVNIRKQEREVDETHAIIHGILNLDEDESSEELPWYDDSNIKGNA